MVVKVAMDSAMRVKLMSVIGGIWWRCVIPLSVGELHQHFFSDLALWQGRDWKRA